MPEKLTEATQKRQVGSLKVEVYPDAQAAGAAAANAVASELRRLDATASAIAVIFATGGSQLEMLHKLTSMTGLPWNKIIGFHLDEYRNLDVNHPASFRLYLKKNLTDLVHMKEFFAIDGNAPDPTVVCRKYAERLRAANPKICLLGVGENGHLAFNDPGEANFEDPEDVKVVNLDKECREQQAAEGWFKTPQDVPAQAITVTIPALFRVPKLILTIPGKRKARILRRTLEEPISTACPATILRTHPDATAYVDRDAAAE